jgi:hypothetical protein
MPLFIDSPALRYSPVFIDDVVDHLIQQVLDYGARTKQTKAKLAFIEGSQVR